MLSIGQFSKTCLVTVKTLRHYEKIGLFKPAHVDEFSGYRYYNESQISSMLLISRLKRYGFSLSDIKDILTEHDKGVLLSRLKKRKSSLEMQIAQDQIIVEELDRHLHDFERTGNIMSYQNNYEISVQETNSKAILSCRHNMSINDFGKYYGTLYEKVTKENISLAGPTLAIYHDEEFNPECSDIELALEVSDPSNATRILPGRTCAVTTHYGAYSGLPDAYGAITKWIKDSGYQMADCPYEIYIKTHFDNLPPDKWETLVYFPITLK